MRSHQAARKNAPCSWQFAGALARATSLHQSCIFVHLLIMLSLALNAVQVRFGGILRKFPNILMLQHGGPGDGKSIALRLVLQVLYYFDSIQTKRDVAKHRSDLRRYEEARKAFQAAAMDDPDAEEPIRSIWSLGCATGRVWVLLRIGVSLGEAVQPCFLSLT